MNTVRRPCCQTLCALVLAWVSLLPGKLALAAVEPPPPPPVWQQEINAARLLEGSLVFTPAKDQIEQEKRHAAVQSLYQQLAQKYPGEAGVQKAVGDFLSRDGQPAAALAFLEKAAQLDPHDGDTANRLGGLYLQTGRTRDAYAQFQRAVEAQPNVASYHSDLANVLYLFRQEIVSPPTTALPDEQAALMQALAHFRRAAELSPADLRLAKAYAETFYVFSKPDWAQALVAWETVLLLSGDQSDFPNSHLARISLRLGKPDAAAAYLARMHDPLFDGLKAQLLKQADRQRQSPLHP